MKTNEQESTDIFLWANHIDAIKNELDMELFLFNKNFTPYITGYDQSLETQVKPIFLYDILNTVNMGAGTGLSVRDMSYAEADNTLPRADLSDVNRAELLIHLIEKEYADLARFSNDEHEFKLIKGMIAKFTHPDKKEVKFYVVKLIQQSQIVTDSGTTWELSGGFTRFKAEAALKMPTDNQVLIINNDIFAFNQSKFESLFKYDVRENKLVEEKAAALDKHFRLSMPDLIGEVSFLIQGNKGLVKKLLEVDTDNLMSQEQVIDIADSMQVDFMTDDNGSIILMDKTDVHTLLDIINDNYLSSPTGHNYLAKSKRVLETSGE
jgi:hypothetical protein